ncbi:MAG: TIGR04255 family protein [Verrucomicrobiota bacterium]
MSDTVTLNPFKLPHPPIVEAVLDIDCDLPPSLQPSTLESAGREVFGDVYPIFRKQFIQQAQVTMKPESQPEVVASQGLRSFQFAAPDEKQIVQIRLDGFSFNRLAPYGSLDDYLPEISRCWDLFRRIAAPVQIRKISLRYINRITIPTVDGKVKLSDYLKVSPNLPDGTGLEFSEFFHQHQAGDPAMGILANIILASLPPQDGALPLLLDISVFKHQRTAPSPFSGWSEQLESLRRLKNLIFKHSLTDTCLNLFH